MRRVGDAAPAVPEVTWPAVLWFFKAECPTCHYALTYANRFYEAYPGVRFHGVAQNDAADARAFDARFPLTLDDAPCPLSQAYGVAFTPTLFVVDAGGTIVDVVEAWSRDGYNHAAAIVARLLQVPAVVVADEIAAPMRPG
ncbi:MAG: TlpA family protein disulfide reductase [Candidatus Xenobia bacterium]